MAEYKAAIEADPTSAEAHFDLGRLYVYRRMLREAAREYERGLKYEPNSAQARKQLADVYYRMGLKDKAAAEYEKVIALQFDLGAYTNLGIIYAERGQYDRAIKQYRNAISANPNSAIPYNNLAWLYMEMGTNLDEALDLARRAVELSPTAPCIETLARVYFKAGMYADAEREIRRAIRLSPDNERYLELLREIRKKSRGVSR